MSSANLRSSLSRRTHRQPGAAAGTACRAAAVCRRQTRPRRVAGHRGRGDRRRGEVPGGPRPSSRHRWRVPPRNLLRQLHQRGHLRHQDRDDRRSGLDQIANGRPSHGAAHSQGRRPHRVAGTAERRRFPLSQIADDADAARSRCPAPATSTTVPAARTSAATSIRTSTHSGRTWSRPITRRCARSRKQAAVTCRSTRPRW